ncbi:hypothetical protein ACO0QE_002401 [Hanseniaspora vineae]
MGDTSKTSSTASSSSWTSFLKSIANFNGDLSSLTAPPFILSPVSLTEYSQYWAEHPDLLLSINNAVNKNTFEPSFPSSGIEYTPDLVKMLHVVRWFISTLKSQYCSRNESMGTEKKPLNPFLGELFVGKWEHEQNGSVLSDLGDTVCLSEQVSHHPPITAYSIFNEKTNVSLEGYNQIKSTFSSTSLSVKQYGHALLRCENKNNQQQQQQKDDTFLITLPSLHIEGLLLAAPFVELDSKSYIQGSSGYFAVIEYSGRGYFSGKKNSFKCKIYKSYESYIYDKDGKPPSSGSQDSSSEKQNKEDKKPLFVISGQWSGISNIYTSSSDEKKRKNGQVFYDASRVAAEHLHVKPVEKQNPLESRRAWEKVANAIKSGDYNLIHQEKSKLEDEQRLLRQTEQEKNTTWKTRWFDHSALDTAENKDFVSLAKMCQLSVKNVPSGTKLGDKHDTHASASTDGANGEEGIKHWRFNKEKWANETEITL